MNGSQLGSFRKQDDNSMSPTKTDMHILALPHSEFEKILCLRESFKIINDKKTYLDAINENEKLFKLIVVDSNENPVVDKKTFNTVVKKSKINFFVLNDNDYTKQIKKEEVLKLFEEKNKEDIRIMFSMPLLDPKTFVEKQKKLKSDSEAVNSKSKTKNENQFQSSISLKEKDSEKTTLESSTDITEFSLTNENHSEKVYKCTECDYYSFNKYNVNKHNIIHDTNLKFKCQRCSKSFRRKQEYKQHLKYHSGEKVYRCHFDGCEMKFVVKRDLTRHIKFKHTHEKPHKCTLCSYTCVLASTLKRHMKIHTGDMNHKCGDCGKGYSSLYQLKRHSLIHSKDKPLSCPYCKRGYVQKSNMEAHINKYHKIASLGFICKVCKSAFVSNEDLELHIDELHENTEYFSQK